MKKEDAEGTHYTKRPETEEKEFRNFRNVYISLNNVEKYDSDCTSLSHILRYFASFLSNLGINQSSLIKPTVTNSVLVETGNEQDPEDKLPLMILHDEKEKNANASLLSK